MRKLIGSLMLSTICLVGSAQLSIELQTAATGLGGAVAIEHAGDDRIFVVRQPGIISVLDANLNASTFLNITNKVDDASNEEGLLGLTFHPDYANNGQFFVNYTASGSISRIERYTVSTADPNVADANSGVTILEVTQPFGNHNAGDLLFGPDGYLYIPWGDGGAAGDPGNRAQNMMEPMGKIYRIDVDNGLPYSIPVDNPYPNSVDTLPEIWAIGLRNPWRVNFDRLNGDLWIGDVGQNAWEEVSYWPAGSTTVPNFGWRCYEANNSYNTSGCAPQSTYVSPVASHVTSFSQWCSVIGGHVYRGSSFPSMYGHYIYTDYCQTDWFSLESNGAGGFNQLQIASNTGISQIAGIGENNDGDLFACRLSGTIYRICPDEPPVVSIDGNGELVSTPAVSYEWFLNGQLIAGATGQNYDPAGQGGSYYVVADIGNGCTFQSNTLNVSGTGIAEELEGTALNLYPVPTDDILWVELDASLANGNLVVLDAAGKLVLQQSLVSGKTSVNTADLSDGHYRMIVSNGKTKKLASFIVKH